MIYQNNFFCTQVQVLARRVYLASPSFLWKKHRLNWYFHGLSHCPATNDWLALLQAHSRGTLHTPCYQGHQILKKQPLLPTLSKLDARRCTKKKLNHALNKKNIWFTFGANKSHKNIFVSHFYWSNKLKYCLEWSNPSKEKSVKDLRYLFFFNPRR